MDYLTSLVKSLALWVAPHLRLISFVGILLFASGFLVRGDSVGAAFLRATSLSAGAFLLFFASVVDAFNPSDPLFGPGGRLEKIASPVFVKVLGPILLWVQLFFMMIFAAIPLVFLFRMVTS